MSYNLCLHVFCKINIKVNNCHACLHAVFYAFLVLVDVYLLSNYCNNRA